MTDKYQQIIQCLETPKTFMDISKECGIGIGSLTSMISRLLAKEMIDRKKIKTHSGTQTKYLYNRLVESATKSDVIAPSVRVVKSSNPFARVIAERHVPSEKKQSPRVYVGCSFNQVGW